MTRRLNFNAPTKRAAWIRAGGLCECHRIPWLNRPQGCGVKLITGGTYYEHINPDAIVKNNSLDNCAVLATACFKEKTRSYDVKVIAKSNRVRDRHRGIGRSVVRPLAGTRASGLRKRMNGTVEQW